MRLLDHIFGKKPTNPPDPTVDWPDLQVVELTLVPYEGRLSDLKFGAPIEHAKAFGKPSRFRWVQNDYCELIYARQGFQIDFDGGRFQYLSFFMDRHEAESDIAGGFELALVGIQLAGGRSGQICRESRREVIDGYFGSVARIDSDNDETILYYEVAGLTMEFEMHPKHGTLMRWNIYPITQEG